MRLFHPLGFMLASPVESAEEGLSYFRGCAVEDKYDGIRAQAHVSDGEVRIFSRTRDDITESFPELPERWRASQEAILDGEIVAWEYRREAGRGEACRGSATPVSDWASEKKVSAELMRQVPVAYLRFAAATGEEEGQRQDAARGAGRVSRLMFCMPRESC